MHTFRTLQPFHRRMKTEALLHALLFAAAITLIGATAARIILFFFTLLNHTIHAGIALGILFIVCLLGSYCFFYRPSIKKTAFRLDELGHHEKISTMVMLREDDSTIAQMQREDALEEIRSVSPKELKIRIPRKLVILCIALMCLLVLVTVIEQRYGHEWLASRITEEEKIDTEELLRIREMIALTMAEVDDSDLSDEEKAALNVRLQALLTQIENGEDVGLEALAEVASQTDAILSEVEDLELVHTIIGEIMKTETLHELGAALAAQDKEEIQKAMSSLKAYFLSADGERRAENIEKTVTEIEEAVSHVPSGSDATLSSEYLAYSFTLFASDLQSTAATIRGGADGTQEISENIQTMEERLLAFNSGEIDEDQAQERKRALQENNSLNNAEGTIDGEANGTGSEDMKLTGRFGNVGSEGVSLGSDHAKERFMDSENIYEPTLDESLQSDYIPGKKNFDGSIQRKVVSDAEDLSGTVSYQSVYGLYYAQLLESMDGMDPEMLARVEGYFYSMIQGQEDL